MMEFAEEIDISYEYLRHFDNIFNTNTRNNIKQMPLFDVFYERFADDFYIQREEVKDLIMKRRITSDKLEETFTEEQQKLFEEYWDLDSQIAEDLRKQLFMFRIHCSNGIVYRNRN